MARGKLLRTKVKEEKALTKARLKATNEFKKSNQGMEASLREHIGKLLDRMDPIETITFLSLVYLIYQIIGTLPEVVEWSAKIRIPTAVTPFGLLSPLLAQYEWLMKIAKGEKITELETPTWLRLLLSVVVAYLIMKHGWELITSIGGLGKTALALIA